MTIALVLGGGAPNLTLMAGAVAALDDAGVEFDIVSTSGAGMLIGLLYAAPKGSSGDIKRDRAAALKNTVNMGVHDAIYRFFPMNFKVFHKPGTLAQAYTKFWQHCGGQPRGDRGSGRRLPGPMAQNAIGIAVICALGRSVEAVPRQVFVA